MKIAMISYYFFPEYSGSAKQAKSLILALRKRNIDSIVIAARIKSDWPEYEIIDDIKVYRVPNKGNKAPISFWLGVARILWKCRNDIDVVHSHGMNSFHGFPLFFSKLIGKPCLGKLSIADSDIDFKNQGRIIGRLHRWFLGYADRYIAISSRLKNELAESGLSSVKCIYIPNGVDIQRFRPSGQNNIAHGVYQKNQVRVLFVGVVDKRKGVDILISAFERALKRDIKAKLHIVGPKNRVDNEGHFYETIKQNVIEMGIAEDVIFYGHVDNTIEYYQSADIFVLPSRQEGLANVILEAMACGLPVIGTRISGTEDIVQNGVNGILVDPGDDRQLADALYDLITHPEKVKSMGQKSLELVRTTFDLDKVTDEYITLYNNLLK